jgi:hypothetical protein
MATRARVPSARRAVMPVMRNGDDRTGRSARSREPPSVARNRAAIAAFYAAGFRALGGHVDLTIDLVPRSHRWLQGRLHDLDLDY